VLNKSDLLPPEEATAKAIAIAQALKYRGPAFLISGATHVGTSDLTEAVMRFLETAEAPAQGNLALPVIAAKAASAKKAKAKKKARAAPKKAAKKLARRAAVRKPKRKKVAHKPAGSRRGASRSR